MDISAFFKKSCIAFLLLILLACGTDGPTWPNISLSESSYDFGGIVLDNSSDRKFVITNNGTAPLTIGDISLSGDYFSILADTCSYKTLAVNGTCSLTARFSPTDQGSFTGTLSIPSNDWYGTETIALSGEGYGLNVWINKIEADDCDVTVDVTVTDPRSNDVLDSLEDNFTLYENDIDISPLITVSSIDILSPISVVLAIDWSGSVIGVIETIKDAANSFIGNLTDTDQAAASKFASEIDFNPAATDTPLFYTEDYSPLTDYIDSPFPESGGTRLYDAVYDSITRAAQGSNEKKVVIVLSDGVDESSEGVSPGSDHTLVEVITHATAEGIPVFTIYYLDPDYEGWEYGNTEVMQRLAEETEGEYYEGTDDLAGVYQQISNVLSSKYTITYESLTTCYGDVSLEVQARYIDPIKGLLYGQDSGTITFP